MYIKIYLVVILAFNVLTFTYSYKNQLCLMTKVKVMENTITCNFIEWIEYHLLVGVQHFYVTDDCSFESNLIPILEYYQNLGFLTLVKSYNNIKECINYKGNEGNIYKKMYFTFNAQRDCEWIGALDIDEYLTFYDTKYIGHDQLINFINHFSASFIRLPGWIYGNYGYEIKPKSLIIQSYYTASLEKPHYIKTIAKSIDTLRFSNPHFPKPKANNGNEPFVNYNVRNHLNNINKSNNLLLTSNYIECNCLKNEEKILIRKDFLINNNKSISIKVTIPSSILFIKHYKYLSWYEFLHQRAATKTLPNGRHNYWADSPRLRWERGNRTRRGGVFHDIDIATEYTAIMAKRLKEAINSRLHRLGAISDAAQQTFRMCGSFWH